MLPFCCRRGLQSGGKPVFMGFFKYRGLLPLDGCRRLGGAVEYHAVDLAAFVGDARRDGGQYVVRNARPVGGHGVFGRHRAQHDRRTVGTLVALHAHGMHVGEEHDRALPDVAIQTGL